MERASSVLYVTIRFVSLVLIVIGLMLLGADLISTLEHGGNVVIRSLDHVWTDVNSSSIGGLKVWLDHHAPPAVTHGIESFLASPGWAVFGVLGVVLAFLFGRRSPIEM
jgi:hypothetical protein